MALLKVDMANLLFGCDACNWFTTILSSCIIFFPFASSRYAGAVAGGGFSGLYSNVKNGGGDSIDF